MSSENYFDLHKTKDGRIFVEYNLPHDMGTVYFKLKNFRKKYSEIIPWILGTLNSIPQDSDISPITEVEIKSEPGKNYKRFNRWKLGEIRKLLRKENPDVTFH